jgi:hypothetical protein
MQSAEASQPILIIAGMHRSGTSLTASLLQDAGLNIGQNFLPSDPRNPKGFFENIDFLTFHEQLLFSLGMASGGWTSQTNIPIPEYFEQEAKRLIQQNASPNQPWGWKEPRTTLFLDFWSNLLPTAKFLMVYRAPWEVIDSLYRRGDETFRHHPEFALQMWMSYNQRILEASYAFPDRCMVVHLSAITHQFDAVIEAIQKKWSIELLPCDTERYEPTLLHSHQDSQRLTLIKYHFPDSFSLYNEMQTIADFPDLVIKNVEVVASSSKGWILQDWSDLRRLERESLAQLQNLQQQLQQTQSHNESLNQSNQWLQSELARSQSYLIQAQSELAQAQSELAQSQSELARSQSHLIQSQGVLAYTQSQLYQTQAEVQVWRDRTQQEQTCTEEIRTRFKNKRSQLQQKKAELQALQDQINAMESSKFWKLRKGWFKLKRSLGLSVNK